MEVIKNIEELNEIISKYFIKSTKTNNFLFAKSYIESIRSGLLFKVNSLSNSCFLIKDEIFYKLYYYLNNLEELLIFNTDKPLVMEIVYRGENQRPHEILNYWAKCGFAAHLTRDNLVAVNPKMNHLKKIDKCLKISYAGKQKEVEQIAVLFNKTLDKYTGDQLNIKELKEFATNKNLLIAYYNGEICGALQFEIRNNVFWLGHLAVDESYRGKGIANELVRKYLEENKNQDHVKYQLWVRQDNIAAIKLYHNFGFEYGNKSTVSMLRFA